MLEYLKISSELVEEFRQEAHDLLCLFGRTHAHNRSGDDDSAASGNRNLARAGCDARRSRVAPPLAWLDSTAVPGSWGFFGGGSGGNAAMRSWFPWRRPRLHRGVHDDADVPLTAKRQNILLMRGSRSCSSLHSEVIGAIFSIRFIWATLKFDTPM